MWVNESNLGSWCSAWCSSPLSPTGYLRSIIISTFFPVLLNRSILLSPLLLGKDSSISIVLFLQTLEVLYFVSECSSIFIIFLRYIHFCYIGFYVTDPLILILFVVEICENVFPCPKKLNLSSSYCIREFWDFRLNS